MHDLIFWTFSGCGEQDVVQTAQYGEQLMSSLQPAENLQSEASSALQDVIPAKSHHSVQLLSSVTEEIVSGYNLITLQYSL